MKIEKNIPVPAASMTETFRQMEVGDSIFLENANQKDKRVNGSRNLARRVGIKISSRQEGTGVRIWRTA